MILRDIGQKPPITDRNKFNQYRRYQTDGKKTECINSDVNLNRLNNIKTDHKSTLPTAFELNRRCV